MCVCGGLWKRGAPVLVLSGRAYSVLSHHDFFVLCPSALGFEWRWHRLAFGSRRGNSWESQDSGFSPHGVAGLTCAALALCSTVPRVPKAMSRFGRLATLESPFHSVFGGPRGRRKFAGCPIHSGTGYPPRSHRSAVSLVEARGSLSPRGRDPASASIHRQVAHSPPPLV